MGVVSRQGSLLLMAFLIHTVLSAPVIEDNTDLLGPDQIAGKASSFINRFLGCRTTFTRNGTNPFFNRVCNFLASSQKTRTKGNGCYYNYEHYEEGDRIVTNEPCLNCTCHNRMLMCYLRVCPFTKAIGQDCKIEKKPDQCCPVITCPQGTSDNMPVALLTSSTTETTTATALGHPDRYGCVLDDNNFYPDGAQVPSDPKKPCELCYCIRNHTACVMQECTLNVEGCKPVYQEGVCCPVRYDCDYENVPTTPRPTVGLITTPEGPAECNVKGKLYYDGELIDNMTSNPCEHCYCMRGEVVCAVQDCGTPLEHTECTPMPAEPGQCCPSTYQCPNGTVPAQALQSKPKPDEGSLSVTEKAEVESVAEESTGQPDAGPDGTLQPSSSDYLSGAHSLHDGEKHESVEHEPNPEHDEANSSLTDSASGGQIDQTSEQPKEQAIIEIVTTARPGDAQEGTTVPSERLQEADAKPEGTNEESKPDDIAATHDQEKDHIEQDPIEGEEHHEEHLEGHDAESTTIPGHYTEVSVENVELNTSPPETNKPTEQQVESDGTNVVEPVENIPSGVHSLDEGDKTVSTDKQETAPATEAPQDTNEAPQETHEAPQEENPAATVVSDVIETTPATTSSTSSPEPEELPRIPGEGSCLYKGITYAPNTDVPSPENCKRCRCVNSIIECGDVECPEPPISLYSNCVPMPPTDDTCCPTYFCEQKPSQEPEAENHLSIDKIDEGIHDEEVSPTTVAPAQAEDLAQPSSGDAVAPEYVPTAPHDLGEDSVSQQSLDVPQGVELDHPAEDLTELEHHMEGSEAMAHPDAEPQTESTVEEMTSKSSAIQETTGGPIEAEMPPPVEDGQSGLQEHSQDGGESHVPAEEQPPEEPSPEVPTTEQPAEPSASEIPSGAHDLGESSPDHLSAQVEIDPSAHGEGMGLEGGTPESAIEDLPHTTAAPAEQEATQASSGAPSLAEDLPQTTATDSSALPTEKPVDTANVVVPSGSGNVANRGEYATESEPEAATETPLEPAPQQELGANHESQQVPTHDVPAPEEASIDGEQHIETTAAPLDEGNPVPEVLLPEVQQASDNGQEPALVSTSAPNQQETTTHPQTTSEQDSSYSESSYLSQPEHIPSFDAQENAVDDHLETEGGATAEAELESAATSSSQAPQTEGPSGMTDKPEEPAPMITTGPPVLFPDIGHQGAPIHVPGPEGISQDTSLSGDHSLLDGERLGETERPAEETTTVGSPASAGASSIPVVGASEEPHVNEELSVTTEGAKPQEASGLANNEVSYDGQVPGSFSIGDNQISESSHTPEIGAQEGANEIVPTGSEGVPSEQEKIPEGTQEATTEAVQSVTERLAETEQGATIYNKEESHPTEGVHDETQPAEGVHDETQPAEGVHDEKQPAEGVHDETQPAGVHDETQPAEGVHDETQPAEGVHDETQPAEGVHDETQPAEGVHDETQPAEGVHDETQPAEGVHDENQPAEGVHDETQPAEGVHDVTQPAEGVHDETLPAEGVHDGTQPAEGVHDETQPAEGVHDETQPAEGVHDVTQPAEGVHDETQPAEGVHDETQPAEGVHDETQPAEGVHDETQPTKGVQDETQPTEGVHDGIQPAGGVLDETQPAEGVHDGTLPAGGVYDGTQPAEGVHDETKPAEGAQDGLHPAEVVHDGISPADTRPENTDASTAAEQGTPEPENSVTETPIAPIVTHGDLPDQPYLSGAHALDDKLSKPDDTVEEERQPEGTSPGEAVESATQPSPPSAQGVDSGNASSEPTPSEGTTLLPAQDEVITHIDSAGPQKIPEIANQVVEPNLNAIEHSSANENPIEGSPDTTGPSENQKAPENDGHVEVMTEQPTVALTEESQQPHSTADESAHQMPDESLLAESEIQTHDHIAEHTEGHTSESVPQEPQPVSTGEHVEQTTQKEEATSDEQSESLQSPGSGSANVATDDQEAAVHHDGETPILEEVPSDLTHDGEMTEPALENVPVDSASASSHPDEVAEEQQTQTTPKPASEPAITSVPEEPSPQVDQGEDHQTASENHGELPSSPEQQEESTAAPEHHEEQTISPVLHEEQPTGPEHHDDLSVSLEHHDQQPSIPESHGEQPPAPEHHEEQPSGPESNVEQPTAPEHHEEQPPLTGESLSENAQGGSLLPGEGEVAVTEPAQTSAPYLTGGHDLGDEMGVSRQPIEEVQTEAAPSELEHVEGTVQAESQPSLVEAGNIPPGPESLDHAANTEGQPAVSEGSELEETEPSAPISAPEGALIDGEASAPSAPELEPSAPESTQEHTGTALEHPSVPEQTAPATSPEDLSAPGLVSPTLPETAPESAFAAVPETAPEQQAPFGDNLESPTSQGSAISQPDQSSHLPEEIEKVPESSISPLSQLSSSPSPPIELPTTEGPALPPALQNWSQKPYHPPSEHQTHPEPPQMPEDNHYPSPPFDQDYEDEDSISYGPGTCRYGGKVYLSAQQIPRDDPCDFCFCFRSDIICLQQSCPPPIKGCYQETIKGFCCPRYECHVSMATMVNITTTSTTTTTTVPPHFLSHHYFGAARKAGCQVKGVAYAVGDSIPSTSGPCLDCRCGADGQMKCDPTNCGPQESLLRQVMAASVTKRRRR